MKYQHTPISSTLRIYGQGERRATTPSAETRLAASVAHEINNPLGVLSGLLFLIEREARFTEKGRQHLSMARAEVERISQIAHNALSDFRNAAPRSGNVPALLRSVLDLYRSRFEAKHISVRVRYCHHGDLPVYSGPLRQVFSNLLLNAVDALPMQGRLYARVSAAHEWAGQHRRGLRVTFADNGSGIAADKLPRVLDPFYTTKGLAGTGLGLAIVKEVVQSHQGLLRVRSSTKAGHSGTVFAIFLPATD